MVYEHFGGKEGLYAVVVDREVRTLLDGIRGSLTSGRQRELIEQAALALLDYIEHNTEGFRILARDSSVGSSSGSFATILGDIASQVEDILISEFAERGLDPKTAPMYAQMLVGMVALDRSVVAGHAPAEAPGGGRPPGQPGLERARKSGGQAPADQRRLTCSTPSSTRTIVGFPESI